MSNVVRRWLATLRESAAPTVALLHPGRCGSTVLGTMLGDRDDVVWDGEVFEPSRKSPAPELEAGLAPAALVQRRRQTVDDGQVYLFAVKYLPSHHLRVVEMELGPFLDELRAGGVTHWITLHRRNYLRRVVSGAAGRARGAYHQRRSDGPAPLVRIRLDPDHVPFGPGAPLEEVFAEMAWGEAALDRLLADDEVLRLTYEDDVEADPGAAYVRAVEFLGLPAQEVPVRLRRTTPFPLEDVVTNHDEIAGRLHGTEYSWMLEG